ncbi:hypothetical protein [Kitasatospora indigofera]|uniref:hypothetical protein n=1 Tax=Kitasatospora indigofera TaxID=67307 RepID=UPI0036A4FEC3
MLNTLLERITGRKADPEEQAMERADAEKLDANLGRLRRTDPELDRIFTVTFLAAHHDKHARKRLVEEIEAYAAAKHAAGRMDLYNALFAGLGEC